VTDLTALEEAKRTHVRYVLIVGLAPICRKCHVDWPCLTGRMIAEHEALQERADYWQILHEEESVISAAIQERADRAVKALRQGYSCPRCGWLDGDPYPVARWGPCDVCTDAREALAGDTP